MGRFKLRFWKRDPPPPPPPPTAWERLQASVAPVPPLVAVLMSALLVALLLVKKILGSSQPSRKRPPPSVLESPGVKVSRSGPDDDAARRRRGPRRRIFRARAREGSRAPRPGIIGGGGDAGVAGVRGAAAVLRGDRAELPAVDDAGGGDSARADRMERVVVRDAGVRGRGVPLRFPRDPSTLPRRRKTMEDAHFILEGAACGDVLGVLDGCGGANASNFCAPPRGEHPPPRGTGSLSGHCGKISSARRRDGRETLFSRLRRLHGLPAVALGPQRRVPRGDLRQGRAPRDPGRDRQELGRRASRRVPRARSGPTAAPPRRRRRRRCAR